MKDKCNVRSISKLKYTRNCKIMFIFILDNAVERHLKSQQSNSRKIKMPTN